MGKSKKDFWGQPIEPSDGTEHHVPKKTRSTKLILTILTLLIIGGVSGCVIMVDNGYLDSEEGPGKTIIIIIGGVISIFVWIHFIQSLIRTTEAPYRVKTGDEYSDLPFDNPPVDYGGYEVDHPNGMYAARNLPPTNDPDEIQQRKWQMRYEQSHKRVPTSLLGPNSVGYWRQWGSTYEAWEKRREQDGDSRFAIGEFTLMVLMALVVGLLIFASCSSNS